MLHVDKRLFPIGNIKGEGDVSGTITVPEVAHDTEEDEYVVRSLYALSAFSNVLG